MENGDLKLRVRALEVERQLERSQLVQKNTFLAVLSGLFLQTGIVASALGKGWFASKPVVRTIFLAAFAVGVRIPFGVFKIRKLDKYNERFGVKK